MDWLDEYRKSLPLWKKILDKIPVIRHLRWIDRYYYDYKLVVKSWWQRRRKGYADEETWNLGISTARWILPRLKHFRNNIHSVPPNLECGYESIGHCVTPEDVEKQPSNERFSLTLKEWEDKLDKMIYAFEFVLTEDEIIRKCYPTDYKWSWNLGKVDEKGCREIIFNDKRRPDYTYYNECKQKYEEGMKLFVLYFQHLWD